MKTLLLFVMSALAGWAQSGSPAARNSPAAAGVRISNKTACVSTSDGPAALPACLSSMYTTYPDQPRANIYNVTAGSGGDLQTKINAAASHCGTTGAIVNVPAGQTYTASTYFNLPPTNCDATHWVVIESAKLGSLPAQGTRVSSSNLINMPQLTTSTPNNNPVVMAADNPTMPLSAVGGACSGSTVPCGYWLAGLYIYSNPDSTGNPQVNMIFFGDYCSQTGACTITSGMTAANLASRITMDRCYVSGASVSPSQGIRHGLSFDASYVAIEDSAFVNIASTSGTDTQAIDAPFATFGPVDIGNNYIEAASEAIFFGGTDPIITNSISQDIYIHQNYIYKDPKWLSGYKYLPKDAIECKNCQRMLVEGNVIANGYDSGMNYVTLQASPRNAYGRCTWCSVNDVTFRYNWLTNVTGFISVLGANASPCPNSRAPGCDANFAREYLSVGSLPTKRVSVHDNVVENVTGPILELHIGQISKCTASGNACRVSDISIVHNSIVSTNPISPLVVGSNNALILLIYSEAADDSPQANRGYNLTIKDNLLPCSAYCEHNDFNIQTSATCMQPTQACGFAKALNAYWGASGAGTYGWIFTGNVITNVVSQAWNPTDIPVRNSDNSRANNFAGKLPANMSNVGFANWNNGTGGAYQLLTNSRYRDRHGKDIGADVKLTTKCTAGVVVGTPGTCP